LGIAFVVVVAASIRVTAQQPAPPDHYDPDDLKTWSDVEREDRDVTVRAQQFKVHFYRPSKAGPAIPAIYACGDGGWRGLAPRTAEQLAHMGFAVAGIDSKVYLREFSSLQNPVSVKQLAQDYGDVARALRVYATVDSTTPVYVYGWSLGAGFAIAVGSDAQTRANWAGVISIGLPKQNQLVSGVGGNHANLDVEANTLYGFRSQDVLAQIAPVPLVMIQSTSDTASPQCGTRVRRYARPPAWTSPHRGEPRRRPMDAVARPRRDRAHGLRPPRTRATSRRASDKSPSRGS